MILSLEEKLSILKQIEKHGCLVGPEVRLNNPGKNIYAFWCYDGAMIKVLYQGSREEATEFAAEAYALEQQIKKARDELIVQKYRALGVDI